MTLLEQIRSKAKAANKTIVLAEGTEERTLKAADIILQEGIARLILLGNEAEIKGLANQWVCGSLRSAKWAMFFSPASMFSWMWNSSETWSER